MYGTHSDRACIYSNTTGLPLKKLPSAMMEMAQVFGGYLNKVDGVTAKEAMMGNIRCMLKDIGMLAHKRQPTDEELDILEAAIKDAAKRDAQNSEQTQDTHEAGIKDVPKLIPE